MHIRTFQWDDLPAIAGVMNAYSAAYGQPAQATVAHIEPSWRSPYNHPERDCFVGIDDDGRMIGVTIANLLDNTSRAVGVYQIPPGHEDSARQLVTAADDHFRSMAQARGAAHPAITMQWRIHDEANEAQAILESQGYALVRQFYTMRFRLNEPVSAPPLPDGFTRRPFDPDDVEAVFNAKVEIFDDHWGEQDTTLDEWRADITQPRFDPALWWIIYAGDEIAGMLLSQRLNDHAVWINIVGVRAPYRRRGLASALLRQCFAEYQRRGFAHIELGVDTDSLTNAVALYQRAGMTVRQRVLYYERAFTRDERGAYG